jgi:ubiquinone/menaquinone biosynthesis C-methylase UbiE
MDEGTNRYYQTQAKKYFDTTINVKLIDLWKNALDIIPENGRILDLGCGSGRDVNYFATQKIDVMGLEFSYNLSILAKNYSNQPIVQADLCNIPFVNKSFDLVWSIGSLLHIKKENIKEALFEIKRVLKMHSILLTSIKEGAGEETSKDGRYFAYYELEEWKNILNNTGFEVIKYSITTERRTLNNSTEIKIIPWVFSISRSV